MSRDNDDVDTGRPIRTANHFLLTLKLIYQISKNSVLSEILYDIGHKQRGHKNFRRRFRSIRGSATHLKTEN